MLDWTSSFINVLVINDEGKISHNRRILSVIEIIQMSVVIRRIELCLAGRNGLDCSGCIVCLGGLLSNNG